MEVCVQENGHHQKQSRCDKFNGLYAILEGMISRQQDDKLDYIATETTWSARASLWGQPSSLWRSPSWLGSIKEALGTAHSP